MDLLGRPIYHFEGVEIDASSGVIKRAGHEQYLRQQTVQVLLYLLEHRDRIVNKEELIDNIWQGAAVTDNALVQCIADIRRALGDDSRQPRFVKTLPKQGYRFICPVDLHWPTQPVTIETEEITSVEIEFKENTRIAESDVASGIAERLHLPAQPSGANVARRLALAAVAVLIAFAVLIYPGKLLLRSAQPQVQVTLPQVDGKKTVAVMPFESLSASSDLDWLREALPDMLITNLSRSPKLTVLGRQQLHLLLERFRHDRSTEIQLDDALQIAQSSRAELVVLGSFARVGAGIHISAQIYDVRSNQPLASEQLEIEKQQDIINGVDVFSLKLASRLGASTGLQDSRRGLSEAMTNNLEAYRCYSAAVEKTYGLQNAEAISLLERAAALDPQFAMAYARIGYAYAVRWSMVEKGRPYLQRAFQLSDRLTEKDRLTIAGWYSIANSDYAGAIRYFQEIVARYPLEVEAYWRLGSLLQGEERREEALDVAKRGLAVDSQAKELYNELGGIYLALNRFDEALEMYQRYIALAPDEPNAHDSLGLFYQRVGRYHEALQSYQRALALKPDFTVALIHLANVYFQQGRYREAIGVYQKTAQVGPSWIEKARGYRGLCEIYLRMGEIDRAEAAAKLEIKSGERYSWHSLLIALRRGGVAKVKALDEKVFAPRTLSNRGARESLRYSGYQEGFLELHGGKRDEAIESFKKALTHRPPFWDVDSLEDCLANAYLEIGRLDAAIAEYERVLNINPNYPLAHYHLGLAYEQKGDVERARGEYRLFLQTWKDADSDIPEVAAARKRLASES